MSSKSLKGNVRFEISTFETRYKGNFVKNRKLILFDPKCPNWAFGLKIWKTNVRFEISTFEIGYMLDFVKRLESCYFLAQKAQIGVIGLKIWKTRTSRKLQVSPISKFWVVLARFGSFWLFPGFGKYISCCLTSCKNEHKKKQSRKIKNVLQSLQFGAYSKAYKHQTKIKIS